MGLTYLFLSLTLSAGICAFILPQIILLSFKKQLFDAIDNRKVHSGIVPRLGGIAFTPSVIITGAILFGLQLIIWKDTVFSALPTPQIAFGLCALILIYLEGISDDLTGLDYKLKFGCQTLAAALMVFPGCWINDLQGILGIHAIRWYIGMPLSILIIVYIINAINLIDGIDGLAAGLSIVASFFLGCMFFSSGNLFCAIIAFALIGTLIPFFIYNVFGKVERGRKIFMGDCGSQTIGLLLGMLALRFSMREPGSNYSAHHSLTIAFSTLMLPCLDVVRVMLGRILRRQNPFLPDKTHFHHKLLQLGMSHRTALMVLLMVDIFFVALNLGLITVININLMLIADIVLWILMQTWISRLISKRESIMKRMQSHD